MIFSGCEDDLPPEKTVGNITFVITEENTPQTLSGVSIQLFSDDDPSVTPTDRTDASGRCTFSNIPIGSYHLNLSKPGYESKEGLTLRVNGGDNPYKEISLKRTTTTLTVAPEVLDFGDNESVVQKAFSLVNPNYEDLTWAVLDSDVPWIVSVCDKDGKKSGTIKYNQEVAMSVTIDRNALTSGNNESTIVILSDYGRAELHVTAVGADRRFPITEITGVTDTDLQTATFKGKVLSVGAPEYEERGFVYSTSTIAEDATEGFTKIPSEMNSENTFSAVVNDLNKGTTYYVRAYGKNALGLKLSSTYKTFTTIETRTSVTTKSIPSTDIDVVNGIAKFGGTIIEVGSPPYSEKGFCYNTSGEPTVSDTKCLVSGTSGGDYYYSCDRLATNTTYYVRAYAIQEDKIYYGTSMSFSTQQNPVLVSISAATSIKSTSAVLNGSIEDTGSPAYDECGFCYSTSDEPTISDNRKRVGFSGKGKYTLEISDLDYRTTYYAKAYAIQNGGVVYSLRTISFTTNWEEASVSTLTCEYSKDNSVVLKAQITNIGDPAWSEKGFCWSTSSNNPTVSMNQAIVSGYESKYSYTLKGLVPSSTYYVRAYLRQGDEVIYGNTINFTTVELPEVYTESVTDITEIGDWITSYNATFNGFINSEGNPPYRQRGFVYSTYSNPQVDDYNDIDVPVSGTGTGSFSKTITGLEAFKTYYVKAYVKTSTGYVYGEEVSFRTY